MSVVSIQMEQMKTSLVRHSKMKDQVFSMEIRFKIIGKTINHLSATLEKFIKLLAG
jgi:hypothetical protein